VITHSYIIRRYLVCDFRRNNSLTVKKRTDSSLVRRKSI